MLKNRSKMDARYTFLLYALLQIFTWVDSKSVSRDPVNVIKPFTSGKFKEGSKIHLLCVMLPVDTPYQMTWFKNGREILSSDTDFTIEESRQNSYMLTIANAKITHSGNYSCVGKNDVGTKNFTRELTIYEDLLKPRNLRIIANSSTTLHVSWSKPSVSKKKVIGYELYWRLARNYTCTQQQNHQSLPKKTLSYTLTDLCADTEYYVWIAARFKRGEGPSTVPSRIRTDEDVPTAPPRNIDSELLGPTAVVITWESPLAQFRNGKITHYGIKFHKASESSDIELNTTLSQLPFSKLEENTKYLFQICAYTSRGGGPWSNKTIKTPGDVFPAPVNVQAVATSNQSVEVWWDPVSHLLQYEVWYIQIPFEDLDKWNKKSVLFTSSTELTGLNSHAIYAVRVAARTPLDIGQFSKLITVPVTPTDVPTQFMAEDVTAHSMSLSWGRPSNLDPIEYKISYGGHKKFNDSLFKLQTLSTPIHTIIVNANATEYHVDNLMPFTSYQINITAVPEDESFRPPIKINVTTAMAAPKPLAKPDLFGLKTENQLTVILSRASEEYGPISHHLLAVVPTEEANRDPDEFTIEELSVTPVDQTGPYIAAKFTGNLVPEIFVLGDERTYQGYINRKLQHHQKFSIFVRAVVHTPQKNLYTSSPFSDAMSPNYLDERDPAPTLREENPVFRKPQNDVIKYPRYPVIRTEQYRVVDENYNVIKRQPDTLNSVQSVPVTEKGDSVHKTVNSEKTPYVDVPTEFMAQDVTTHSISLCWRTPTNLDSIKYYKLSYGADKQFYDSQRKLQKLSIPTHTAFVDPNVTEYHIDNLMPFTSYQINITAVPEDESFTPPSKINVTTAMAAPKPLLKPDSFGIKPGNEIALILPRASEEYGPISHHLLVVVPTEEANKDPDEFTIEELTATPVDQTGPYIAAKFEGNLVPETFDLGDGWTYRGYVNRRLQYHQKYSIFVRAFVDTPQKNLYTSSPFSHAMGVSFSPVRDPAPNFIDEIPVPRNPQNDVIKLVRYPVIPTEQHSPDTLNTVQSVPVTEKGDGTRTTVNSQRLLYVDPGKLRRVKLDAFRTVLTVRWIAPAGDINDEIRGYQIHVQEINSTALPVNDPKEYYVDKNAYKYYVDDMTIYEYHITKLKPETLYSVQIAAVTEMSDGDHSEVKTDRTYGGVPSQPHLFAMLIQEKPTLIAEVLWSRPTHTYGALQIYKQRFGRADCQLIEEIEINPLDRDHQDHKLYNLDQGTRYEFHLSGGNEVGWGEEAYTYLDTPAVCGGNLLAHSSMEHFYSHVKYGDENYDNNMDCYWIIRSSDDQRIKLKFLTFEIESRGLCAYDVVEVYDGEDDSAEMLGTFCGNKVPPEFNSSDNSLMVHFRSDYHINSKGFSAAYGIL